MRRTACTARPATSRTRGRTSSGSCRKAAAARTTRTCDRREGGNMKTVAELLRTKPARVVKIRPEQSVLEAIKVLATEDIGAAVVLTGERIAGIISERDYTRKVVLKGRS